MKKENIKDILVTNVSINYLKEQRDYLLKLQSKNNNKIEGLINMLDFMIDKGEENE